MDLVSDSSNTTTSISDLENQAVDVAKRWAQQALRESRKSAETLLQKKERKMARARLGRSHSSEDDPGDKQSKWEQERDRLDSGFSSNSSASSGSINSLPDILSDISLGSPTTPGL